MIRTSKQADERFEAGAFECWCLHGAVGMAAGFRDFAKRLVERKTGARAVDLWRFLEGGGLSMPQFAAALNAEVGGEARRGSGQGLLGYSMGGRLALHALLEKNHPWSAAVIVSAHPGLREPAERRARRSADAVWARKAMLGAWTDFLKEWDSQPVLAGGVVRDEALVAEWPFAAAKSRGVSSIGRLARRSLSGNGWAKFRFRFCGLLVKTTRNFIKSPSKRSDTCLTVGWRSLQVRGTACHGRSRTGSPTRSRGFSGSEWDPECGKARNLWCFRTLECSEVRCLRLFDPHVGCRYGSDFQSVAGVFTKFPWFGGSRMKKFQEFSK